MATFPKLKDQCDRAVSAGTTRAVPESDGRASWMVANSVIAIRRARGLEWDIQLSQLDEGELAAIEEFFLASQGRSAVSPSPTHGMGRSTTTAAWPGTDWH